MLRDDLRSHGTTIAFLTDAMSVLQALVSEINYTMCLTTRIRQQTKLEECYLAMGANTLQHTWKW